MVLQTKVAIRPTETTRDTSWAISVVSLVSLVVRPRDVRGPPKTLLLLVYVGKRVF